MVIVGGGLAGLALSIQIARQGHSVIVFEKERYPFHKVCGEYISLESWDFLQGLGVDLDDMKVSIITQLQVSSINGKLLELPLPQGGFGISRYRLDHELAKIARVAGVTIEENTKVDDLVFDQSGFVITTSKQRYRASIACGCFGKRSNLDIKWKRPFVMAKKNKLNNYVGVKYHIKIDFPANTICLHNFSNGYCGLVKIEDDLYNLCYLTTAGNLKKNKGNIPDMERTVLSRNPHLKKIFLEKDTQFESPVTISQISFDKKNQVEDHVLMIGDAAGMITALCGNGMSMALHGSKLAANQINRFLQGHLTREKMEQNYIKQWQRGFGKRLRAGRRIQRLFGSNRLTNFFIVLARPFPGLIRYLIRQTHGEPF